ncbi:MAG TPA: DUF2760 domain-containing protein [Bryobacteraceae bacterium]|nr:DUF2760 domain-containing protein [Bryobacteraceae bacterium]
MNRISFAFRSFFSILFRGKLAADIAQAFGYARAEPARPAAPPRPQAGPSDGAVQILSILQRDARLIDFLMEDISSYSDEQVGAAVRDVQQQARKAMLRYLQLSPVIDGVEGTYVKSDSAESGGIKLIGNVPANGKAPGGTLRHKGWKADKIDLPGSAPTKIVAAAEIEIE